MTFDEAIRVLDLGPTDGPEKARRAYRTLLEREGPDPPASVVDRLAEAFEAVRAAEAWPAGTPTGAPEDAAEPASERGPLFKTAPHARPTLPLSRPGADRDTGRLRVHTRPQGAPPPEALEDDNAPRSRPVVRPEVTGRRAAMTGRAEITGRRSTLPPPPEVTGQRPAMSGRAEAPVSRPAGTGRAEVTGSRAAMPAQPEIGRPRTPPGTKTDAGAARTATAGRTEAPAARSGGAPAEVPRTGRPLTGPGLDRTFDPFRKLLERHPGVDVMAIRSALSSVEPDGFGPVVTALFREEKAVAAGDLCVVAVEQMADDPSRRWLEPATVARCLLALHEASQKEDEALEIAAALFQAVKRWRDVRDDPGFGSLEWKHVRELAALPADFPKRLRAALARGSSRGEVSAAQAEFRKWIQARPFTAASIGRAMRDQAPTLAAAIGDVLPQGGRTSRTRIGRVTLPVSPAVLGAAVVALLGAGAVIWIFAEPAPRAVEGALLQAQTGLCRELGEKGPGCAHARTAARGAVDGDCEAVARSLPTVQAEVARMAKAVPEKAAAFQAPLSVLEASAQVACPR